jgi:hypothetical protein
MKPRVLNCLTSTIHVDFAGASKDRHPLKA